MLLLSSRKIDYGKNCEIEGQVYVKKLYEELGFVQTSNEFLDDGIPPLYDV